MNPLTTCLHKTSFLQYDLGDEGPFLKCFNEELCQLLVWPVTSVSLLLTLTAVVDFDRC